MDIPTVNIEIKKKKILSDKEKHKKHTMSITKVEVTLASRLRGVTFRRSI